MTLDVEDARLDLHAALIPFLSIFLAGRPLEYPTLCEVGCGSGRLLRECTGRLPQITRYVGLNVNSQQTLVNRERYRDLPLRFESVTLLDWLTIHATRGTIYVADAECLALDETNSRQAVLQAWRRSHRPTAVAISVPLAATPSRDENACLLDELRRIARAVKYDVEMPIASSSTCRLWVAEF